MRRWASIAWGLLFLLLAFQAGCGGLSARLSRRRDFPSQEKVLAAQQCSERAQAAIDRGDLESAKTEMLQLIAQAPGSAEGHHRLGKILQLQGRLKEAEACYRRALVLDPDYVGALTGLGTIELENGETQSALKRFETAIEIEPRDAEAHFARGRVLEAVGDSDGALAAYFRTLEFNPLHPSAVRCIGAIQLLRSQPDQALVRLDQAVDLSPEDGEIRLLRGRAHLMLHHAALAIEDFRAAARQFPDRADIYFHLALALEAARQPSEAIVAAETALRLAPENAAVRDLSQRLRR